MPIKGRVFKALPALLAGLMLMLGGCYEMEDITVTYADGSGNRYLLTAKPTPQIDYRPVKPAESSSGLYDGGQPAVRPLSATERQHLIGLLESAIANPADQISKRVMQSGLITIKRGDGEESYILKPGSPEQLAIEAYLRSLVK